MENNKIFKVVAAVFLLIVAVYLAILSRNAIRAYDYIGISQEQRHSIVISGEGEVVGVPDVAIIQIGHSVEKKTVAEAQKENTEKINKVIEKLKNDFRIDPKDIKTANYNIYPAYDWRDNRQVLRGYQVSQDLTVKIREIEKVSQILDLAGTEGLNQIGGLSFEIDKPEELESQAREKAIKAAKEKAEALARAAGVKLGRIISFSESSSYPGPVYQDSYKMMEGVGGGESSAPAIEAGSTEIKITATVEYEIL